MLFTIALLVALFIFATGTLYKISLWFRLPMGIHGQESPFHQTVYSAFKGTFRVIMSKKILYLFCAFIFDVLFQRRLLQASFYRWSSHMLLFWGFCLLLFMHAFEAFIMEPFFSEYTSTQNPYLFLRNLGGAFVLCGLIMSIFRNRRPIPSNIKRSGSDIAILIILSIIIVSGFFLEGLKITSKTRFMEMVEDYSDEDDPQAIKALEYYWIKYYGLVPEFCTMK